MKKIKEEYPEELIKKLFKLKNSGHGILGSGEINDPNFKAWKHDTGGISSRLILYKPSRGLLDGKAVEINGFEFQSNYNFCDETYFHQFISTNFEEYSKLYSLTRKKDTFLNNFYRTYENLEELKKEHEAILLFTGKEVKSNISRSFLPKNNNLIDLLQLEKKAWEFNTHRNLEEIYSILSAYAQMGIERVTKRMSGTLA